MDAIRIDLAAEYPRLHKAFSESLGDPRHAITAVAMCALWAHANTLLPSFGAPDQLRHVTAEELNEWFHLYSSEAACRDAFHTEILSVADLRTIKSSADDSSIQLPLARLEAAGRTLLGLFLTRVVSPYDWWHDAKPWTDFKDAGDGDENALKRLVKIDRLVLDAPAIKSHWGPRMESDRRLRERISHHELVGLDQYVEPDPASPKAAGRLNPFQRRRQKLKFAAHIQLWARRRGSSIPPRRISLIFDAMHSDFGWADDEFDDLPIGKALEVQLRRWRTRLEPKNSSTAG